MNLKEMSQLAESLLKQGVDPLTPIVLPVRSNVEREEDPTYELVECSDIAYTTTQYTHDPSPKMHRPVSGIGAVLILDVEDALFHMQLPDLIEIDKSALHRQNTIHGPKQAGLAPSIFGGQYVNYQQLGREELLEKLRQRINKGYMPSATREGYNSKPEYVRWLDLALAGHERAARNFDCTGYFKRTDEWGLTNGQDPIWLYIETNQFEYVINLQTDEIRVRRTWGTEWVVWDNPDLKLAEDKRELFEVIEDYV